jgi:DNA replication protein DnaC
VAFPATPYNCHLNLHQYTGHYLQLMDMCWIEEAYNLFFLGPSSIGKTHLSISLGVRAVELGYHVSFVTLDELIDILKTEAMLARSKRRLKRIMNSSLVIIDEVGSFR